MLSSTVQFESCSEQNNKTECFSGFEVTPRHEALVQRLRVIFSIAGRRQKYDYSTSTYSEMARSLANAAALCVHSARAERIFAQAE